MPIFVELQQMGGTSGRLVPAGVPMWFAGVGAPTGYLVRDGSSIAVADYPALFAVLGYTYGGAGANFNLPDDRGLGIGGAGLGTALPGLTNKVRGTAGGDEAHALTIPELASHTHLQDPHTHIQDPHTHTQNSHNHTQDPHTHVQNSHTHLQDPHTHIQDAHTHLQNLHFHTQQVSTGGGSALASPYSASYIASAQSSAIVTNSATATNQNATATNQNATATNQGAIAVNQNATATNQATAAVNLNTTATNQDTVAVNQSTGSGTAFSIIQPTRYYTPIISY